MSASTIEELNASDLYEDQEAPVLIDPERRVSNVLRMAKCLTRYDLKKNCIHIHD